MLEQIDDHIIAKRDILLRPGASRRFLFRGTPGGQVTIRVGTKRGPNLPDTEEPVDDLAVRLTRGVTAEEPVDDGPHFTPVGDFIARPARLTTADDAPVSRNISDRSAAETARARAHLVEALSKGVGTTPGEGGVIFMDNRPFDHSILGLGNFGDLVVVRPGEPLPPVRPRPPMRVRVSVQDGPSLRDETVTVRDGAPGPAHVNTAGPFPGHDIIEVTYTNPNDFPVLFYTFINVQNDLTQTTTVLTRTMLERVFRNTLMFLAPSFGVRNGRLFFSFSDEVRHTFGIDPIVKDIGVDADVTVNIEPVGFELLNHEFVIRQMVSEIEAEIRAVRFPNLNLPPVPSDFVPKAVAAFFSPVMSLPYLFGQMGLYEIQWMAALSRRPLLGGPPQNAGERDDVALRFHLRMTEIIVGASRLELNVDTITATLYVVLRSGSRPEPHPVRSLPDDLVRAGFILPRFHLSVDISDIDVNLDLPGGAVTKPFEFIAKKGLEEVADWIKDDLEKEAVGEGMAYLDDFKLDIGEFATSIMREIANRAHVLRRLYTDNRGWVIDTLDPAQLAVPFVEPDEVDHRFDDINVNHSPVEPIDGRMPSDATERLGRVDHLVFLTMENRSFDHMLGYLSHPNHGNRSSEVDGLDGRSRPLGGDFAGTVATPQPRPRLSFAPDPGHGVDTVAAQIADGAMNGFVSEFARRLDGSDEINPHGNLNDPERILKFYTADQLDTYDRLTRTDMVLDRWFCSFPGATYPNRVCCYTGYASVLNNSEVFDDAGYITELTLFEVLDHENVDWIVYESDISFLRVFESYRLERGRIRPIEELFTRTQALPPVTFIDPNFTGTPSAGAANDDHPPTNVKAGQAFIAEVISALQELPSWPTTMLVIFYDEHGGFADHVAPPGSSRSDFPPEADGSPSVPLAHPDVASYGPRVPAFAVSPVITAGGVGHRIYDHATAYRTIIERFTPQLRNSAIIPERVRRARHLGELVEPGIGGGSQSQAVRFTSPPVVAEAVHPAVIRRDNASFRPHLTRPPDTEDFHFFMTRIGNPIKLT